jgi:hypothetical protein
MSSRKFQISLLETVFLKLLFSIQLGDNYVRVLYTSHGIKNVIEFPVRHMQLYTYFWATWCNKKWYKAYCFSLLCYFLICK